ncbi:MAG: hypothetical protein NT049_09025 [Planctomycetota bacterium]|nr:hypothetical protein [Planctomycetota bacterium]
MAKARKVLAVPPLPVRPAFKAQFLDFERGIRMGNIEPHERITQIIKAGLMERHRQDFIIDKWGRGVYWQWICWVVRADREAKPISSGYNFSCAKFFISLDRDDRSLQAGMQVERAYLKRGRGPVDEVHAEEDWDFYRLLKGLRKGSPLEKELRRLVEVEGFTAYVGGTSSEEHAFRGRKWGGAAAIRRACEAVPGDAWGWFQLYYAIPEKDLGAMDGGEIVAAILAVFNEVTPAMNLVMSEPFLTVGGRAPPVARL